MTGDNHISGGAQRDVIQAQSIGSVTFGGERARAPQQPYLQGPGRWPVARDWDALAAGAHRARPGEDGSKLPPYVARDVDGELRERVREAADAGGLVLVVGDSTAGKTRAAFEAVRELLPGYRVLAPPVGARLRPAPEVLEGRAGLRCVVWLDDLEQYLGPEGLEPEVLAEFVRLRVPVVATMRLKPYEAFSAADDGADVEGAAQSWAGLGARVLRVAEVVDLDRLWSERELSRAGDCDDPRIADAVAHHGTYGIAEYMAAGPVLLREWQRARRARGHARGAALVTAAVDLSRAGLRGPYSRGLLVEVHERCLADAGGPVLRPEGLEEAFAWASRVRLGVTSPLVPVGEGWWSAFDYLVDGAESAVPEWVREAALAHAADDAARGAVATSAYRGGALHVAEAAVRPLADKGDRRATYNLAVLLGKSGRTDEAEALYRDAHGRGHLDATNNLANLLAMSGRTEEAEALYRQAIDRGHLNATNNLAVLLARSGRTEEAETLYRQACDRGHLNATNNLAILLKQTGRAEEAEALYRQAHSRGHPNAAYNLAILLSQTGRTGEAEDLYRQAHDGGHPSAAYNHAILVESVGRTQEAETLYRQAHDRGQPNAAHNLALLLDRTGRAEEAEALRSQAADNPPDRPLTS
ncbi:tetratricopeptide repeat protein [Streptomyces flavofungini]|uniref:tetratricopeptide repeat protein n=1 Tax=Streptomyces flavofungini TaxID=68200 RepID=UPI0025AF5B95|nr:tetratricopeptide repeat protein [Streptomyces flavofungini]WJV47985.1 tetratricopeptide repeat protein [Streptomyces flavofungini]